MRWLVDVVEKLRPGAGSTLPTPFPDAALEAWMVAERAAGVDELRLVQAVAEHFSLPVARLEDVSQSSVRLLPFASALKHRALPIAQSGSRLRIALCDPMDAEVLERLRFSTSLALIPEVESAARIENAILRVYGDAAQREAREVINLNAAQDAEAGTSPVVALARRLLILAVERRGSDLHLQPYMGGYLVRLRVDGVLIRLATLTDAAGTHVVRHLKAVSGMDSTDSRTPQDGRCTYYLDELRYDLRLSTVPNNQGERLVIRLLNQSKSFSLEKLGYAPARVQTMRRFAQLDSGLVLFVGPTGSGKTTALYALVSSLNSMERSIATIEQPVEYIQPGLSQVEVRPERGTTFASVLRAQLRQDPDVLLIGEIRDEETAQAAVRAALTGHLVFSTMHTSAARYTIPRLIDMGVSAAVIGETLRGVVSQRLMRRLCPHCAVPVIPPFSPSERLVEEITLERPRRRAVGCSRCDFTGYRGVVPVVEIFVPSARERADLLGNSISAQLWDPEGKVQESGNPDERSLAMRALDFVVSGETSIDEALKVVGPGLWTALARHFSKVGWFEGAASEAALSVRGSAEADIILVGPDAALAEALARELADSGYRVVQVHPEADAQSFLARHPNACLLIFDLVGDETQAMDMLKSIRQSFAWSGIPAVILVPDGARALREMLEMRLANRVVSKPVDAHRIAEVVLSLSWGNP